jgi:hypothetical protein
MTPTGLRIAILSTLGLMAATSLGAALAASGASQKRNMEARRASLQRIAERLHAGAGIDAAVWRDTSDTVLTLTHEKPVDGAHAQYLGSLRMTDDGYATGRVLDAGCRWRSYSGRAARLSRDLDLHAFPTAGHCIS